MRRLMGGVRGSYFGGMRPFERSSRGSYVPAAERWKGLRFDDPVPGEVNAHRVSASKCPVPPPLTSLFSSGERQRLLISVLESSTERGGARVDFEELTESGLISSHTALVRGLTLMLLLLMLTLLLTPLALSTTGPSTDCCGGSGPARTGC